MSRLLPVVLLAAIAAFGQPKLTFEAASVKPDPQAGGLIVASRTVNPIRVTFTNFTLGDLIRVAYRISSYQVQGPPWMARERYDVVATKTRDSSEEQTRQMLQSLLADRFHLAFHREQKELPGYALLPGKDRSKLRPEKDAPETPGCAFGTMTDFAGLLARSLQAPVADQTGIAGTYYFIFAYSDTLAAHPAGGPGRAPPPPPPLPPCPGLSAATMPPVASSIFEAVSDQMGLKLERRGNQPVSVLVVDRADRVPTAN